MRRLILLAAITAWSGSAICCQYETPKSFHNHVATATQMYVFRIESLAQVKDSVVSGRMGKDGKLGPIVESNEYLGRVAGRITILRALRGKPITKYIEFNTSECGGLRLDVGHYFFVATTQTGPILRLSREDRSVVDLRRQFRESYSDQLNDRQPFLSTILKHLKGKPFPKDFPSVEMLQYTQAWSSQLSPQRDTR